MTSAGQNEIQLLSVASSWPIEAHCCQHCSDTMLSHPHASDRRRGRDPWLKALGLRAPWTCVCKKLLKQNAKWKYIEVKHAINHHTQRKPTTFIHACIHLTCSSFLLTEIKVAEVKWTRSLILWRTRSATSYVAATFHPTIGQRAP